MRGDNERLIAEIVALVAVGCVLTILIALTWALVSWLV